METQQSLTGAKAQEKAPEQKRGVCPNCGVPINEETILCEFSRFLAVGGYCTYHCNAPVEEYRYCPCCGAKAREMDRAFRKRHHIIRCLECESGLRTEDIEWGCDEEMHHTFLCRECPKYKQVSV